ncbi:hypothetical protein QFZ35_003507 [Arthrobacter ulcerisalmonis]|nr:hypothetical protein [Arthrobacter ulcerisalmonis]
MSTLAGACGAEEQCGGDVGAELGKGAVFAGSLEAAGGGGGAVPDGAGGVPGEVEGDPGHAVPVRGVFHPPVGHGLGEALFQGFGVVAFPPSPDLGPEPGRDELTGGGAAGRVRGGGVEEVRHQPGGTVGGEAFGFIGHDPGVLPGDGAGGQRIDHRRQGTHPPGLFHERSGGRGAEGEDSGDLLNRGHLGIGPVLDRGVGRGHGLLELDRLDRVPGLHCRELRFQPGRQLHAFQPELVPPLQDIHISTNTGSGGSQKRVFEGQRIKGSNRGMNTLQHHPNTPTDSHEHIIQRGCDI